MKYYQIDRTGEPKIIGVTNGSAQVEVIEKAIDKNHNYLDFENHFSGYNLEFWQNQQRVYDLTPPPIKGKILKKAKLTDIIEYGPNYHFLYKAYSEKYINIIRAFNIPRLKTFDFEIENISEKYHLLFFETVLLDEIDYEKSKVISGYKVLNNIKYHSVNNRDEYIAFNYNNPTGGFELIAIPKKYLGKDIISIEASSLPFYSERLIDFLLDCKITGLQVAYNNSIQLEFV